MCARKVKNTMLNEKVLGMMTSVTGSTLTNAANYVAQSRGFPDTVTVPVIVMGLGTVVSLWLDVMFAKKTFGTPETAIPYTDLQRRFAWFLTNARGSVGVKYFTVALFDGVIAYWIYSKHR